MAKVNLQKEALQQANSDKAHLQNIADTKKAFLDAVAAAQKAGLKVDCNFNSTQGENLPLSLFRPIK